MNSKKDQNAKFNSDNIHPIKMTLLEGQAEIILRALELYAYNLEYMLDLKDFKLENDEILNKRAKLRYTYETIASYCAEARGRREAYNSEPINNTENKILELIKSNKYITQPEIAKILNLSENCIYKNLKILKNKNLISRIGANKNGYWKIRDIIMDNVRDNEINFDEIIKNII